MKSSFAHAAAAVALPLCLVRGVSALGLPSEPIVLADRVTLGGNLSATIGPEDTGFFNYTDYEDSTLRLLRMDLTASYRAGRHLMVLGELRSQNVRAPKAYALYVRVRPWPDRRFDIQAGRIPPTFGAFPRRSYEADNPLIAYPLAYQYLTSLRADAVPASADELLQMRGRGWLASYSIGNPIAAPGVPLASATRWDTGVQAHGATDMVEVTASITAGTLSNPRLTDDNGGRQVAGRIAVRPVAGLMLGASGARGPFVSTDAVRASAAGRDSYTQTAWGGDLEYSRGYYVVRVETVASRWELPTIDRPLRAIAAAAEGRYKIRPGLYAAARVERLGFNELQGATVRNTWDASVKRLEAGIGYSIERNLLAKVTGQFVERDGGRTRRARLIAGQLVYWF
jgi:hypothetical protein